MRLPVTQYTFLVPARSLSTGPSILCQHCNTILLATKSNDLASKTKEEACQCPTHTPLGTINFCMLCLAYDARLFGSHHLNLSGDKILLNLLNEGIDYLKVKEYMPIIVPQTLHHPTKPTKIPFNISLD